MKSMRLCFLRSFMVLFIGIAFVSCDEPTLEIPFFQISQVSVYEKGPVRTHMTYGYRGLSEYQVYIDDSHACTSTVKYSSGNIYCVINDVAYDIKLSNTKGGTRAENITATNTKTGGRLYYVEYEYDDLGRIWRARIDGIGDRPAYTHYVYENNGITIDDVGTSYRIELSSEKNKGYVCNVLDYSNAPYTCSYVINPHLYYLNIYGTPVDILPYGYEISYSNGNISRVGHHTYKY